jgi:DNA-directed RNA polymerase specialized sigma24 family protein
MHAMAQRSSSANFGGLSAEEIAEVQQASPKTVRRDLAFAQAWLYRQMKETAHP